MVLGATPSFYLGSTPVVLWRACQGLNPGPHASRQVLHTQPSPQTWVKFSGNQKSTGIEGKLGDIYAECLLLFRTLDCPDQEENRKRNGPSRAFSIWGLGF